MKTQQNVNRKYIYKSFRNRSSPSIGWQNYWKTTPHIEFSPFFPKKKITKILRWFEPNNFWWKRNRMLIENTCIRVFGIALLREFVDRIIEKPLPILSFQLFFQKKKITKILRWFKPNNFWWKRDRMLIENTYIRIFGIALLRESVDRIIEKPLLILCFHLFFQKKKNTISTCRFFFRILLR